MLERQFQHARTQADRGFAIPGCPPSAMVVRASSGSSRAPRGKPSKSPRAASTHEILRVSLAAAHGGISATKSARAVVRSPRRPSGPLRPRRIDRGMARGGGPFGRAIQREGARLQGTTWRRKSTAAMRPGLFSRKPYRRPLVCSSRGFARAAAFLPFSRAAAAPSRICMIGVGRSTPGFWLWTSRSLPQAGSYFSMEHQAAESRLSLAPFKLGSPNPTGIFRLTTSGMPECCRSIGYEAASSVGRR